MTIDRLIETLEAIKNEHGSDITVLVSAAKGHFSYHLRFNEEDVRVYCSSGKPSKFVAIKVQP